MRLVLAVVLSATVLLAGLFAAANCVAEPINLAERSTVTPIEAATLAGSVIYLDVRSDAEWASGHIRDALHIPHDQVPARIGDVIPGTDIPIVTYCVSGGRASMVVEGLRQRGYRVVPVIGGGYRQMVDSGLPSE
ncbi:MAG: rhodanese-like domain-containing protein [Proteobacteria bacterium]|jgi:rhodanese-related sulfurtransferase|nr:rhodanese-like domain-containing protein [Pseudomonadota bacterium]MDA1300059.1 rhodanese-like domain-containing protein [Pseudomonadota bacterium]